MNPASRCPVTSLLQWRHNERDGVSNHQPHDCLLNRLFRRRSKKISKLRVTGLCEGNSSLIGEIPAQRASNAENVSICWRHHVTTDEDLTCWYAPQNSITWGPYFLTWINLITAWKSNYMHYNMCDEIAYPFPNFNSATEFGKIISSNTLLDLLIHTGNKVIHVSKKGPWRFVYACTWHAVIGR